MKHSPSSLLIADDYRFVRESCAHLLHATGNYLVATTDNNIVSIETCIKQEIPVLILLDINVPDMFGLKTVKLLRQEYPFVKMIGIAACTLPTYIRPAMDAGIKGILTRRSSFDNVISAIGTVLSNKNYISDDLKNVLADQSTSGAKSGLELLSMRETEIIRLIKLEYSSKDIARHLDISHKTVEAHRYNIQRKLNLRNVAGIINFAHRMNL